MGEVREPESVDTDTPAVVPPAEEQEPPQAFTLPPAPKPAEFVMPVGMTIEPQFGSMINAQRQQRVIE